MRVVARVAEVEDGDEHVVIRCLNDIDRLVVVVVVVVAVILCVAVVKMAEDI